MFIWMTESNVVEFFTVKKVFLFKKDYLINSPCIVTAQTLPATCFLDTDVMRDPAVVASISAARKNILESSKAIDS